MLCEMDALDGALNQRAEEHPGLSIAELIRPFLLEKSESVLRDRVRMLALLKKIKMIRSKREVRCYPFEYEVVE